MKPASSYGDIEPTEPIFHQCADISIVKTDLPEQDGYIYALAQSAVYLGENTLVQIAANGMDSNIYAIFKFFL